MRWCVLFYEKTSVHNALGRCPENMGVRPTADVEQCRGSQENRQHGEVPTLSIDSRSIPRAGSCWWRGARSHSRGYWGHDRRSHGGGLSRMLAAVASQPLKTTATRSYRRGGSRRGDCGAKLFEDLRGPDWRSRVTSFAKVLGLVADVVRQALPLQRVAEARGCCAARQSHRVCFPPAW